MDATDSPNEHPEILLSVVTPPSPIYDSPDGSLTENRNAELGELKVEPSLEFGLDTPHHNQRRRSSVQEVILTLGHEIQRVPDLVVSEAIKVGKNINTSHAVDPFTTQSIVSCLFSMLLGIADYITDILVAFALAAEDDTGWWLTLTIIFVIVPLVLVNMFSIFWFHQDHLKFRKHKKKKKHQNSEIATTVTNPIIEETQHPIGAIFKPSSHSFSDNERNTIIASHIVGLGPILRYVYIIYCGCMERKLAKALVHDHQDGIKTVSDVYNRVQGPYCPRPDYVAKAAKQDEEGQENAKSAAHFYSLRKYYERDSAYLGLIEAFIQDGPQLILQLYILAIRDSAEDNSTYAIGDEKSVQAVAFYQCASVLLSLVSLSWSIVSYQQASRWATPEKPQMSPLGCWFQFLWKFFVIASRVMILSLFATEYKVELFIFIGLHWMMMTVWILFMKTNFCGSAENTERPVSEVIYNAVMGFVFTFDIVNVKDGPTRYKHASYYTLALLENAALLALWYTKSGGVDADDETGSHKDWTHDKLVRTVLIALIPSCYVAGISCMLIYYRYFHPEGKMPNKYQDPKLF